MTQYVKQTNAPDLPGVPTETEIDLTYRCNNRCRHCWLCLPPDASDRSSELSFDEIASIVDDVSRLGKQRWMLHGGEPMIRLDFAEIFDYITSRCASYTLNTNGTLITPEIAKLLRKRGSKLVSLYGATADVHDHVTRNPGSFEATIRGMRYLKEAGAGFTVQVVPMTDNEHQTDDMCSIADALGAPSRIGTTWLWFTACGDAARNKEIARQRLSPSKVLELDPPKPFAEFSDEAAAQGSAWGDDRLFARCSANSKSLHIDPYGAMSFCRFVRDPDLRYDLRKGSALECWSKFLPSLADRVRGGNEYEENCGSCKLRNDCKWCPVYANLEHGRYSAKVQYLCDVAEEARRYRHNLMARHRRYFGLGGLIIQVESDLPFAESTFHPKMRLFEVDGPGEDNVVIRHHSSFPKEIGDLGEQVYKKAPYAIYRKGDTWTYLKPELEGLEYRTLARFNSDYSEATIYNRDDTQFRAGGLSSLTMLATDQVVLAQVFARREALYVHASGAAIDDNGFLFVGHSEAGKSTMVKLLDGHAEVLCDERIIVRKWPDGIWIHGSWSHGEVPIVSPNKAPLRAICFIEKALENRLEPILDAKTAFGRFLPCVVKPHETREWWDLTLSLIDDVVNQVPAYILHFDKSGEVLSVLQDACEQMGSRDVVLR